MNKLLPSTSELRKFGLAWAAILVIFWLFRREELSRTWQQGIWVASAVFFASGVVTPHLLLHPYRGWMWLGSKIGFVTNRILLMIVFLFVITPIGWIRRIFERDPLHLKFDSSARSYFTIKTIENPDRHKNLF